MNIIRFLLFLLLCLGLGCVSQPVDEGHFPSLMISQNSDGETTLTWNSALNYIYTIQYQDSKGGRLGVLRGAKRIRGNGKTLSARDRVDPLKPARRYHLEVEPSN